ncbi:MAG: hypothetical protein DME75_11945 [Verrucomicrobia bacterium]|nr:MAG: hypothetical protein DME75_11945 [Verrucomicrobiota bacterium]
MDCESRLACRHGGQGANGQAMLRGSTRPLVSCARSHRVLLAYRSFSRASSARPSDGYATGEALNAEVGFAYHREQAETLAALAVDLLYAPTFPAFSELYGAARAIGANRKAVCARADVAPGRNDARRNCARRSYSTHRCRRFPRSAALMIGCLYPTHAQTALRALRAARPDLVTRVRGLKANASPLSPEELDKLRRLAATDCQTWALDGLACAREFGLTILGAAAERVSATFKL